MALSKNRKSRKKKRVESDRRRQRSFVDHMKSNTPGVAHVAIQNEASLEAYVEWLIEHPSHREPKTFGEMAEKLGVHRKTLYEWRKREDVRDWVRNRRENLVEQHMPEIIDAMISTAKMVGKDGANDRRLVLSWLGYISGGSSMTTNVQINNVSAHVVDDRKLAALVVSQIADGLELGGKERRLLREQILGSLMPASGDIRSEIESEYVDVEVIDEDQG